jgi:hypothetical protein
MKVYMNGYPDPWLSPYTIIDHVFFWTEWSKCSRRQDYVSDEEFVDHPDWVDRWAERLDPVCQIIKRIRQVLHPQIRLVKIDRYDTWSMDHTLAHIIHPMLVQLQATKHGAPFTDDADVPETLRSTIAQPKLNEWDTDEFHHARWDWILEEMIWAFHQELRDDDEAEFYDHTESDRETDINESVSKLKVDRAGLEAHQKRKANGFRLFGKYFQALWD